MRLKISSENPQLKDLLDNWQKEITNTIFLSLVILGLIAYIPSFILSIKDDLPYVAIIDTLAYTLLLVLTFWKKTGIKLRALLGSLIAYVLGLLLLLFLGPIGAGNMWLLGFSLIAALTLGEMAARISFLINLATQIVYYIFLKSEFRPDVFTGALDANIALIRAVNFVIIDLLIVVLISVLTRKLEDTFSMQKKLQSQLIHSQKMEAIGQLTGGIAHDFNNVLTGIISSAYILQSTSRNLDDKDRKMVDLIYRAGMNGADLISKINNFSRKSHYERESVNIKNIILETESILKKTINRNLDIELDLPDREQKIKGNVAEFQNLMMNLSLNAVQAMTERGKLRIRSEFVDLDETFCKQNLSKLEPGNYIKITISDTGTGISRENLTKIFDPFFTTKDKSRGSGLGLTTVYNIVESHKGMITVESQQGNGTDFFLYFPASREEKKEGAISKLPLNQGKTLKILVVDDEEIVRTSTGELLENLGHTNRLAADGKEAIAIFTKEHRSIDLVLLDMIMPGLGGKEVFTELRKINPDVRVILCSGYSSHEDLDYLWNIGLNGFVKKPFTIGQLDHEIIKVTS